MIYIIEWVKLCKLYDYRDCYIIMYDIYLKTMLYEACMKYAILIKEKHTHTRTNERINIKQTNTRKTNKQTHEKQTNKQTHEKQTNKQRNNQTISSSSQ